MNSETMNIYTSNGVTFMRFKILEQIKFINHAVSTRHGGISTLPELKSLNLGFKTADSKENVTENFKRFCKATGIDIESLVFAKQTHSANVRYANESDRGKGLFRERDYTDVDASVTDRKNVSLLIHTADCVPIAYVDTKNKAIANAHCGWRGTFSELASKTLNKMQEKFGTNPKDVICAIGPCICVDCYEVSKDLYDDFLHKFGFEDYILCKSGKYYLDLPNINKRILTDMGVCKQNIAVCDLCTCCNKNDLFSHRGLGPKRGLISSVITIK